MSEAMDSNGKEATPGRAVVLIDERILRDLLQIPRGIRVLGTAFDPMRLSVVVHLEGDGLPPIHPGEYAPAILPIMCRDRRMNDAGIWEERVFVEWPLPMENAQ